MERSHLLLFVIVAVAAAACTPPGYVGTGDYNRFALKAQEEGLWREAEYRLRQALLETPHDARLHNNLAVALEAQGKLEEAHAEYQEAVKLDPANETYRLNLREFTTAHRWEYELAEEEEPAAAPGEE
jgi:Tfp pilus assembly protein PilF